MPPGGQAALGTPQWQATLGTPPAMSSAATPALEAECCAQSLPHNPTPQHLSCPIMPSKLPHAMFTPLTALRLQPHIPALWQPPLPPSSPGRGAEPPRGGPDDRCVGAPHRAWLLQRGHMGLGLHINASSDGRYRRHKEKGLRTTPTGWYVPCVPCLVCPVCHACPVCLALCLVTVFRPTGIKASTAH